jgi:NADPH:quinone reductase-like Zn-dependent oxidoreductase
MRVIDIKRPTSGVAKADSLYLKENHPDPVLQPGYVLVRVKAFGLNRMDIMQREGVYPLKLPESAGKILGVEFGGLVEKLGEGCTYEDFS